MKRTEAREMKQHFWGAMLLLGMALLACGQPPARQAAPAGVQSAAHTAADSQAAQPAAPDTACRQLLLVTTPGWEAVQGSLRRFERCQGQWQPVGSPIPIVVGKKGMAWGRGMPGMQPHPLPEGPHKVEGDLKSPAGVFRLLTAFGYASPEQAKWIKMPYLHVRSMTQCIEDVNSRYYNHIVPDSLPQADWNSTDHMLRKDDLYEWGLVVGHNTEDIRPGAGSCIFLHVANPRGTGTAGCTAMKKDQIRQLLQWLDPAAQPLLVQMPTFAYPDFQARFDFPPL